MARNFRNGLYICQKLCHFAIFKKSILAKWQRKWQRVGIGEERDRGWGREVRGYKSRRKTIVLP